MKRFFIFMLLLFLPIYLLLQSLEINTFNKDFYLESFKKYDVVEVTGRNLENLSNVTDDLLNYLRDESDEEILESNFNEREIMHMEDVKNLFDYGFTLKNISFILSLASILILFINRKMKSTGKGIFYGIFIWWGFILLLLIISLTNFNKYFTYFHLIFFNNDLWILNPNTDLLIQMLPEKFFLSIFKRISLLFLVLLSIIQIIGYILMKRGNDYSGRVDKF